MHISTVSDKEKIAEMFKLLAATGKLVKITELNVGVGVTTNEATEEDYVAQAEMCQYIIEKYMEIIPAAQRYGITVWSPVDSSDGNDEPVGL
jgi:endo-1,4-beta-xylanase